MKVEDEKHKQEKKKQLPVMGKVESEGVKIIT